MSRRDIATILADVLDRRREDERDVVPRRVIGRNTDGSEQQLRLDGTCPERGEGAHRIGEIVTMPTSRPDHRGGSGGGSVVCGGIGVLWVDRQEPRELVRGSSTSVRIFGRGLSPGMEWEYLRKVELTEGNPSGTEPDPEISVDEATYVDDQHYDLEVTVAEEATLRADAPIAFSLSSRRRRDDFYDVVAGGGRNLHGFFGWQGTVRMAEYLDGAYVADVGTVSGVWPVSDFYPIYGAAEVSDGSIAWIEGGNRTPAVKVWDWTAAILHEWILPQPWEGYGAVYLDGYLWFVGFRLNFGDLLPTRLYRASADLSSVEIRSEYVASGGLLGNWSVASHAGYPTLCAPTHCGIVATFTDANGETVVDHLIRYSIPEGLYNSVWLEGEPSVQGLTIPVAGGGIFLGIEDVLGQWDGNEMLSPWWPSDWDEPVGGPSWNYLRDGVARSRDGSRVYIYNHNLRRLVIGAAEPGPVPEAVIDMEPHPSAGDVKARFWPAV